MMDETCMPALPLPLSNVGRTVRLHKVSGGGKIQAHLSAMGFVPGSQLELISSRQGGPYIVTLKDGRVVLGHGMAQHIWVK